MDRGQFWSVSCVKGPQRGGKPQNSTPPLKLSYRNRLRPSTVKTRGGLLFPCSKGRLKKGLYRSPGTPPQALHTINTQPRVVFAALVSWTIRHLTGTVPLAVIQFQCAWLYFCPSPTMSLPYSIDSVISLFGFGCPPTCVSPLFCFNVLTDYPNLLTTIAPGLTQSWFLLVPPTISYPLNLFQPHRQEK